MMIQEDRGEDLCESSRSGRGWIHLDSLGHRHHELHDRVSIQGLALYVIMTENTYEDQRS
jgi:hypothetical protein